ncbi:transcription factor DIVARICATA-like [Zingiber officinale]|uniref:transcription factor DIVARICATA-like n=1 Tax=Zingiber officinale TaxID=94328 RepID=UPI001C4D6ACD|nr:transcription factor DIVARICATA-like [Zingiber officinale]XP_042389991.1 transcription factor DIVARICATA-like [Zingiber officinale]XP_042389992.1 transcription factor DIVARICATA-like [Zingiber officinale]
MAINAHFCLLCSSVVSFRSASALYLPHSRGLPLREPGNLEKGGILHSLYAPGQLLCIPFLCYSMSRMEILTPRYACCNWYVTEKRKGSKGTGTWTQDENKRFEDALARFDKETPDRWVMVASSVPGKTPWEVENHYLDLVDDVRQIESGRIPCPGYDRSFSLEWEGNHGFEGLKHAHRIGGKRRTSHQERKKGVPWTEAEHKLFLLGLKEHGKGDWRNISRNFVITRTPAQVASHAQKYFIRLNSRGKDKRRSSIHDITTVNLSNNRPPPISQPSTLNTEPTTASAPSWIIDSYQHGETNGMFSSSAPRSRFMNAHHVEVPYS